MKLKRLLSLLVALAMVFSVPLTTLADEIEDTEAGVKEVVRGSEDEIPDENDGWRLVDTLEEDGDPIYGDYTDDDIIDYEDDLDNPIYGEADIIGEEDDLDNPIYDKELLGYETDETKPIYSETEIEGYEQGEPIYEIVGYENGDPIYDTENPSGYEQKNAESGIIDLDITSTGNSGSFNGTKENGLKIGSDNEVKPNGGSIVYKMKSDVGNTYDITISEKNDKVLVAVPAGVTITVRVQNSNLYSYYNVTGPMTYEASGNNVWMSPRGTEAKVDDLEKPLYQTIIGYEQGAPIYSETEIVGYEQGEPIYKIIGYEEDETKPIYGEDILAGYVQKPVYGEPPIIGYEKGEPIYGERPIIGYQVITKDLYKRFITIEDILDEEIINEILPDLLTTEEASIETLSDFAIPTDDTTTIPDLPVPLTTDTVNIPDAMVPLASMDTVTILDDDVPLSNLPTSGGSMERGASGSSDMFMTEKRKKLRLFIVK